MRCKVTPPNGAADVAIAAVAVSPRACESLTNGFENNSFSFLLANVQGFVSKSADLAFFVENRGCPEIVGFTVTFLDKSKPAELNGYVQISRLDRRTGEKCGGIILFAKQGSEHAIVHVGDSEEHERSWFVIHSNRGAILL